MDQHEGQQVTEDEAFRAAQQERIYNALQAMTQEADAETVSAAHKAAIPSENSNVTTIEGHTYFQLLMQVRDNAWSNGWANQDANLLELATAIKKLVNP
jgi:hypothetical protein